MVRRVIFTPLGIYLLYGLIVKWYYAAFVPIYENSKMFCVYILKSEKNNSYYIGSCENIEIRLEQHNNGKVKSTKRYIPWRLVFKEEHKDLRSARKREIQIKRWKKRSAIENLIKHF